jgi:hypothetical protein
MEENNQDCKSVETNSTTNESSSNITQENSQLQQAAPTTSSNESTTMDDSSNKINLTIKTPKEKENVLVKPDATIKEVILNDELLKQFHRY